MVPCLLLSATLPHFTLILSHVSLPQGREYTLKHFSYPKQTFRIVCAGFASFQPFECDSLLNSRCSSARWTFNNEFRLWKSDFGSSLKQISRIRIFVCFTLKRNDKSLGAVPTCPMYGFGWKLPFPVLKPEYVFERFIVQYYHAPFSTRLSI